MRKMYLLTQSARLVLKSGGRADDLEKKVNIRSVVLKSWFKYGYTQIKRLTVRKLQNRVLFLTNSPGSQQLPSWIE